MANTIHDLGDGLILRSATVEDTDDLAIFNSNIHKDPDQDEPNKFVDTWVRDLMAGIHPTLKPTDFTMVVDTKTGKIVSSLNLIPQTWCYEGIEFGVGRPELVGTDPEYRRRGLVRAQMEVVHQWSEQRGHKVQAITGIPYYYRQFGYEMCMNLGGSRVGYRPHVPKLKDSETEKYTFRPATQADIGFIAEVYHASTQRSLVSCVRNEAIWQYDIFGKNENARAAWRIIQTTDGESVGFCLHTNKLNGPNIQLWRYELAPGISYLDVTPALIRYLESTGVEMAENVEEISLQGYSLRLGGEHPAYDTLPEQMPHLGKPYAWYLRVPNLPGFLTHIGPVLEKRLAESPAVGFCGDLKLSFYRSGIKLVFEKGKIKSVDPYQPQDSNDGDAFFPHLTFLQLLFGYTSFRELDDIRPDCYAQTDHGRALTTFLFPKKTSDVWAIS